MGYSEKIKLYVRTTEKSLLTKNDYEQNSVKICSRIKIVLISNYGINEKSPGFPSQIVVYFCETFGF